MNPPAVDNAAHVVQLALTPIFLLSGLAALLNVFSTRLGRIPIRSTNSPASHPNVPSNSHCFGFDRVTWISPSF